MQYISKILVVAALALVASTANAQPPARKGDNNKKSNKAETTVVVELTERARSQYPATQTPQEVDWKREIYRSIDLANEKNASLYYPVEQIGDNCNLFTFLFNNILNLGGCKSKAFDKLFNVYSVKVNIIFNPVN